MFELLTHLLHNDHGERAVIVAFLTEHWPMLRVWLAARSEAHGSANRGATHKELKHVLQPAVTCG